jgi:WD40 repeat protein
MLGLYLDVEEHKTGESSIDVSDMSWDANEDHLIVAFSNGALAMLDFGGFEEGQSAWKFLYEAQKVNKVNKIVWRDDKSGDFITSSRKVGALKIWNVASNTPKETIKVGSHGIHQMRKISGDTNRILLAFTNGAV